MRRQSADLLAFLFWAIASSAAVPALADGWSWLDWTGRGTGVADRSQETLEAAAGYIATLPAGRNRIPLAAGATDVGHWRLVNRAGEPFTAAGTAELGHALETLAPESKGQPERLDLYLTADTVFRHRTFLADLPATARLHVLIGGQALGVERRGSGKSAALWIAIAPSLLVEAEDRALFEETRWQLTRPIERSRIRTLSFEPGGPTLIRRAPVVEAATRRAAPDRIEPRALGRALGGLAGGIALVAGRVDGERLAFTPESGKDGAIEMSGLVQAASQADANLIVLGTSSARQPGTRNWLWQRVELGNFDQAVDRTSLGAFLQALVGQDADLVARTRALGTTHVLMELTPRSRLAAGPVGSMAEKVSGTWSDLVTETAGTVGILGIRAVLLSQSRQTELDRRLVAGIPSAIPLALAGLYALGFAGFRTLLGWWQRIWPAEAADDYGGRTGHALASAVRWLSFALLFVPLAGGPAVIWWLVNRCFGAGRRPLETKVQTSD